MTLNDKDAILANLHDCRYLTGSYRQTLQDARAELNCRIYWWMGRHIATLKTVRATKSSNQPIALAHKFAWQTKQK